MGQQINQDGRRINYRTGLLAIWQIIALGQNSQLVSAILCYECGDCLDAKNEGNITDTDDFGKKCVACEKRITTSWTDVITTKRSCLSEQPTAFRCLQATIPTRKLSYMSSSLNYKHIILCTCDSELCNAANSIIVPTATLTYLMILCVTLSYAKVKNQLLS